MPKWFLIFPFKFFLAPCRNQSPSNIFYFYFLFLFEFTNNQKVQTAKNSYHWCPRTFLEGWVSSQILPDKGWLGGTRPPPPPIFLTPMTRKSTWCKKTVHLPKYHWKLGKTCQLICTISPQQKVYNFKPVDPFLSFHKTMFPIWEDTVHPSLQWSLIFLIRQRSLWEPTQSAWLRSRKAVLMETGLPARKASSIPLTTRPWLIPLSNGRMSWVFFRSWFGILLLICKTVIQFLIIFETLKI